MFSQYNVKTTTDRAAGWTFQAACSPEELVRYDQYEMEKMIDNEMAHGVMPDAALRVTFNGTFYLVELSWKNFVIHKFFNQEIASVKVIFHP